MTVSPSIRLEAADLSARLPGLIIASRNVAQTVRHGVHGRRKAGSGEISGNSARSFPGSLRRGSTGAARPAGEHAFVREREWESAHTVWIWFDRSASMRFGSSLAPATKIDRAAVVALAFADLCVSSGERAGLLGLTRPLATSGVIESLAEAIATDERLRGPSEASLPPPTPASARSLVLLVGDFLDEAAETERTLRAIAASGAVGELVMIADPIEETYPYAGHVEFRHPGRSLRLLTPRAQNLREAYLARLAAHRDELRQICSRLGWRLSLHRTDASAAEVLLALRMRLSAPEIGAAMRSA